MSDFWSETTAYIQGNRSEFFNAKYDGQCTYVECYKCNQIELGDGCEYYKGELMHMRCARAAEVSGGNGEQMASRSLFAAPASATDPRRKALAE